MRFAFLSSLYCKMVHPGRRLRLVLPSRELFASSAGHGQPAGGRSGLLSEATWTSWWSWVAVGHLGPTSTTDVCVFVPAVWTKNQWESFSIFISPRIALHLKTQVNSETGRKISQTIFTSPLHETAATLRTKIKTYVLLLLLFFANFHLNRNKARYKSKEGGVTIGSFPKLKSWLPGVKMKLFPCERKKKDYKTTSWLHHVCLLYLWRISSRNQNIKSLPGGGRVGFWNGADCVYCFAG